MSRVSQSKALPTIRRTSQSEEVRIPRQRGSVVSSRASLCGPKLLDGLAGAPTHCNRILILSATMSRVRRLMVSKNNAPL